MLQHMYFSIKITIFQGPKLHILYRYFYDIIKKISVFTDSYIVFCIFEEFITLNIIYQYN